MHAALRSKAVPERSDVKVPESDTACGSRAKRRRLASSAPAASRPASPTSAPPPAAPPAPHAAAQMAPSGPASGGSHPLLAARQGLGPVLARARESRLRQGRAHAACAQCHSVRKAEQNWDASHANQYYSQGTRSTPLALHCHPCMALAAAIMHLHSIVTAGLQSATSQHEHQLRRTCPHLSTHAASSGCSGRHPCSVLVQCGAADVSLGMVG